MTHTCTLLVFARAPVAGEVKTRLFRAPPPALGAAEAAELHWAFLQDLCDKGARSGIARRRLYISGAATDQADLAALGARHGFELRAQTEGDLGQRMDAALRAELPAGPALIIGSDAPTLPLLYLREAAAALGPPPEGQADLVLGPACDGGYYLIGSRAPCPALFAPGIAWGTDEVLEHTLDRLRAEEERGRRVHLLPFHYDVDTPRDLRLLRRHLALLPQEEAPRTRALLLRLG